MTQQQSIPLTANLAADNLQNEGTKSETDPLRSPQQEILDQQTKEEVVGLTRSKSSGNLLEPNPPPQVKRRELSTYQGQIKVHSPTRSHQSPSDIKVTILRRSHMSYAPSIQQSNESWQVQSRGLSLIEEHHQFHSSIQFSPFQRWALLIVTLILNAFVPSWITLDIQSEGITRNAWRFFTMSVLMIPFVMFQQRGITRPEQKFRQLLRPHHLKRIFISSINHCVWTLFGVMATKYTAGSHSFCFLRLRFFLITLIKLYKQNVLHQGQVGGVLLVGLGIIMMLMDSLLLPVNYDHSSVYEKCAWWQRLMGDFLAIAGCLILFKLQSKYQMPKGPRFTIVFLNNLCISVNLVVVGYYFGGNQFSFDPNNGIFGLFTSANFVSIFYVSIILGLNMFIGNVLVDQIFSLFIRNMASCFQIVVTTTINHIFAIQRVYSGVTSLGLCFIVPGMMMIVGGQGSLQKLQMRINSQINTGEKITPEKEKEIADIIMKYLKTSKQIETRSAHNLNMIKEGDQESQQYEVSSVTYKSKME